MKMNRIWSCLTRGLRSRPPPPSQSSSQCSDDNDNVLQKSGEQEGAIHKESHNQSTCVRLLILNKKNKKNHHDNHKDYFHTSNAAESLISKVSSAIFWSQVVRYISSVFNSNVQEEKPNFSTQLYEISLKPSISTVRSVLPNVSLPSVPVLKSTVHAAGESEVSSDHHPSNEIDLSNSKLKASKQNTSLIDSEDLEEFTSSVKESIGITYNVQGIKEYKAGNYFEAFRSFELGSQNGTKQAQFNLAICYEQGKGTKKNLKKAKQEYTRAARQGHEKAQYNLALMLLNDQNLISFKQGLFFLEKSAENGLVQAQTLAGAYFAQRGINQNMRKAVKMFKLAVEQQDTLSTYHLAECYEHGLGGLEVDTSRAFDLYATAASQGHHKAHFKMALILLSDCPEIEKNEELALEILKKAKDLGHEESAKKYNELMNAHELRSSRLNTQESILSNHNVLSCSIGISQLIFPGLLQKLNPSAENLPEEDLVASFATSSDFAAGPFHSSNFHRVCTWPNFGQSLVSFSYSSK